MSNIFILFSPLDNSNNSGIIDLDLSGCNFSGLYTANWFAEKCPNLETVDLRNATIGGTYNVTLVSAFSNCPKLTKFDGTGMTIKSAKTSSMFAGDSLLEEVYLPNLTASSSYNISGMYNGCSSLRIIDMRSFDFSLINKSSTGQHSYVFKDVPNDCLIIVKNTASKNWITSLWSNLTNVKTVSEYEASL